MRFIATVVYYGKDLETTRPLTWSQLQLKLRRLYASPERLQHLVSVQFSPVISSEQSPGQVPEDKEKTPIRVATDGGS